MASIQLNDLKNIEVSKSEQGQVIGGLLPAVTTVEPVSTKDHKNWINVSSCNMGGHK